MNYFLDGTYCELINNVCTATREIINSGIIDGVMTNGCGTEREINVHRCVAHTSSNCYYD